jgi:hypothetical protein
MFFSFVFGLGFELKASCLLQVLYCLSHVSAFFPLVLWEIVSCFFAQDGLDFDLPVMLSTVAGMIGMCHSFH